MKFTVKFLSQSGGEISVRHALKDQGDFSDFIRKSYGDCQILDIEIQEQEYDYAKPFVVLSYADVLTEGTENQLEIIEGCVYENDEFSTHPDPFADLLGVSKAYEIGVPSVDVFTREMAAERKEYESILYDQFFKNI